MEKFDLKELSKKISGHPVIKEFQTILNDARCISSMCLAGGAVVDILEGREPKDYDFVQCPESAADAFLDAGFKYVGSSSTADTYERNNVVVQFLTTNITDFDFKISQSRYRISKKELILDRNSFENKVLIPVSYKRRTVNTLRRIRHWEYKGYKASDSVYFSLLNQLSTKTNDRPIHS